MNSATPNQHPFEGMVPSIVLQHGISGFPIFNLSLTMSGQRSRASLAISSKNLGASRPLSFCPVAPRRRQNFTLVTRGALDLHTSSGTSTVYQTQQHIP